MARNLKQNLDVYLDARKISDKNIQLDRERLTVIKKSKTNNDAQKKASPTPVAFFVYNIESPYGVKASIDFKVVTQDIFGGNCDIIGYEIYKDGLNETTEGRENRPILIAAIDPSQITDDFFSFTDPSENELASYYTVVAIDSIGNRSQALWQKYYPEVQPINDLSIVSYSVNSDKSIDFNLSIVHTMNDFEYDGELLDFYDMLDSIQLKLGSDWISGAPVGNFKELSINYQPKVVNGTLNFRAVSHKNTLSDNVLQLSYGEAGYDINYTVGTLNQSTSSVEEDLYTSRDGTVQSRIKVNLDSDDSPPKVLVKLKKSGEVNFKNVLEIDYDDELYVENGAYTLEAGVQYYLEVYPKTEWGLLGDKIEFDIELVGKDEAPTPVYFTDETGTEITSKTFEKGFDLTWEYAIDADDDTYELRYGSTTDTWETATFLWKGRADRYYIEDFNIYSGTTVRVFIKSRNRSGKEQETARYIDCDNNTPSKPNTPTIENASSGGLNIYWDEIISSNDKDISYYNIIINEDGTDLPNIIKNDNINVIFPPSVGSLYKCKVQAVDIFGQTSTYSDYSSTVVARSTTNQAEITIYASGGDDTSQFNNAFLALANGGSIKLNSVVYNIDASTINCIATNRINMVCNVGQATIDISNGSSSYIIFNLFGGEMKNIDFVGVNGSDVYAGDVSDCSLDGGFLSASEINKSEVYDATCTSFKYSKFIGENLTASYIRSITVEGAINHDIYCYKNIQDLTASYTGDINLDLLIEYPDDLDFPMMTGSYKFESCSSFDVFSNFSNKISNASIYADNTDVAIIQQYAGVISGCVIFLGGGADLTIEQKKPYYSGIGAPPRYPDVYFSPSKFLISDTNIKKRTGATGSVSVFQGYVSTSDTYLVDTSFDIINCYIDGNTETLLPTSYSGNYYYNNNTISGTESHNTF